MLEVSDEIKNLYASTSQPKHLIIYFPELEHIEDGETVIGLEIPQENIKFESMSLDESICEDDNITFVGCISSKFTVTLYNITYDLNGQKIEVSMTIGDTNTPIPLFNGWVSDVELETNRAYKDITAYDAIYSKISGVDVANWYNTLNFPITLGNLRVSLFEDNLSIIAEEATLPNDDIEISKEYIPESLDALDVVKSICQINGVFGIINRQGNFEYRTLNPDVVAVFGTNYKDATYREFTLSPAGRVVIRESANKTGISYPVIASKTSYIVQSNIFMAEFEKDTVTKRLVAGNIYGNLYNITYRPFEATNYGAPWLECGDTVSYTMYDFEESAAQGEDIWVTASYTILKRHLSGIQNLFDEFSAEGNEGTTQFISDIGLTWEIETDLEKASSAADENKISFSTSKYSNVRINSEKEGLIAKLPYRCAKGSFVVFHSEIEMDMGDFDEVEIYYTNYVNRNTHIEIIDSEDIIPVRKVVGNTLHLMWFFSTYITSRSSVFRAYIKNNNAEQIKCKFANSYLIIKGEPAKFQKIEVEREPDKVQFAEGERLDYTGVIIVGIYTDGTKEDVTEICSFDPSEGEAATLDMHSVKVTLEDEGTKYTTSFSIDVLPLVSYLEKGPDIHGMLYEFNKYS